MWSYWAKNSWDADWAKFRDGKFNSLYLSTNKEDLTLIYNVSGRLKKNKSLICVKEKVRKALV